MAIRKKIRLYISIPSVLQAFIGPTLGLGKVTTHPLVLAGISKLPKMSGIWLCVSIDTLSSLYVGVFQKAG